MKLTRTALVLALAMMLFCGASIFTCGSNAVLAQDPAQDASISFEVALELAETGMMTIPVQIDSGSLYGLMSFPPTNAAIYALSLLNDKSLTTPKPSPTATPDTWAASKDDADGTASDDDLLVNAPTDFSGAVSEHRPIAVTPLALTAEDASVNAGEPSITNANAYQRVNPTTDSAILGQIPEQTEVYVDGRNADGEWLHLADGSWVARFLLDNVPASLPIIVDGVSRGIVSSTGTITGDSVILRDGPSQANDMVGMYDSGVVVAVLSRASNGDWLEVVTPDGAVGWMTSEFLHVEEDVDALPVVVTVGDTDIYGTVVDSAGLGVDSAVISAVPTNGSSDRQIFATSAGDGSFLMTVPDESVLEWSVWIDNLGCESRLMNDRCQLFGYYLATPHVEIELPLADALELVYADATSFIAGTVVDGGGAPEGAGIIVTAFRDDGAMTTGATASSGKFVLPADSGTWSVSTEYGPSVTVNVEAGSAPDPIEVPSK